MKVNYPITILDSLWKTVEQLANREQTTVSKLFEMKVRDLVINIRPIPIRPNRRIEKYGSSNEFYNKFPHSRHTLTIDIETLPLQQFIETYKEISSEQYKTENFNKNDLAYTVFYYLCIDSNLLVDELFFDDNYFTNHYSYQDEDSIKAIKEVAALLKRSPTSREYKEYYKKINGPSLSYIERKFGNFNNLKRLAHLPIKKNN